MTTDPSAGVGSARSRPGSVRGAVAARLAVGNPSRLLYGAVVSAAMLAVMGGHTETGSQVLVAVASVLIVYWLVHVYVEILGDRFVTPTRGRGSGLWRALRHEGSILQGGVPALLVVVISLVFGASVSTATTIAQWVTVVLLGVVGHLAAHRAGRTGWRLLVDTLVAALFGVLTVVLKTQLH